MPASTMQPADQLTNPRRPARRALDVAGGSPHRRAHEPTAVERERREQVERGEREVHGAEPADEETEERRRDRCAHQARRRDRRDRSE